MKINNLPNLFIAADKTKNLYKVNLPKHNKLLKSLKTTEYDIKMEAKNNCPNIKRR